jgi:alpha-galactosidase
MTASAPAFRSNDASLVAGGVVLAELRPLIDGEPIACGEPRLDATSHGWTITWPIQRGPGNRFVVAISSLEQASDAASARLRLDLSLEDVAEASLDSIGLRIGRAENVLRYLRHGYTSWDGSYFIELDSARGVVSEETGALAGHAVTALVSGEGQAAVLGFLRHDRFQSCFRFSFAHGPLTVDVETLLDRVPFIGSVAAEPLILLAGPVEDTLRAWAHHVAAASPKPPRIRGKRISGWCSWYNLYASITEASILEHLRAAAHFRDRHRIELEVFQIDDGFTPEMGDWLHMKPQFPRGMAPLLADVRAAGFTPGLWIAPLMVGNRSRLYAEHPDWVIRDRATDTPLAPMKFYGEFRWHKRSEEYYVLDITHPDADAYVRKVFRTWRRDWGCGYFKIDFMHFGCEYGPKQARRHRDGESRIATWMRMVRLIREEIGDALLLASGSPIWAPIGWIDAVRIGRDIGVSWKGHYSAESLLRDQAARNFANGIFWQADPDCILLRERFHDLTEDEVHSLALFAGLAGGVLMTSDQLDDVSDARARLFATLARSTETRPCEFPRLGLDTLRHRPGIGHVGQPVVISEGDPVLVQRVRQPDGSVLLHVFNTGDREEERLIEGRLAQPADAAGVKVLDCGHSWRKSALGVHVRLRPHTSCRLLYPAQAS